MSSCFECETCHKIKVYEDAQTGTFDVPTIQEVCTRKERKTLLKDEFEGVDGGGNFKTFWVCDILDYEEQTEE